MYDTHGKTTKLNFTLDYLKIGQRVGFCVTQSGELHCYVDGIDKGVICTGLPTDVSYWGIVDVYSNTNKIQLISPKASTVSEPVVTKEAVPPIETIELVRVREQLAQTEKEKNNLEQQNQELQIEKQKREIEIQEMKADKQKLQTKIQEMKLMNQRQEINKRELEELQMANQELQATNQELQGNVARLSIENMRLNEQVKELKQQKVTAMDESWKVNYKEVTLTKQELGRGGWGVIWIGEFRGQKVAVKQMHELIVSPEFLQLLNREINTMAQLRHPNLLQFIGAVLDHPSGNPMIITEIMDISLRGAYEKKQLSPVPVSICLSIMRDVAVGLNYLHCLPDPIIHRDVSSANVLLESKGPGKWKTKMDLLSLLVQLLLQQQELQSIVLLNHFKVLLLFTRRNKQPKWMYSAMVFSC